MRTGFPYLSKFLSKLTEIVGAGLASAAGAFLLGHIATPSAPPPVVQIVPADADTIRMVRGDQVVVDDLRKDIAPAGKPAPEADPAPQATITIAPAPVKVEKPAKPAPAVSREHKAETSRFLTGGEAPVRTAPASHGVEQPTVTQVGDAKVLLPASTPPTAETTSEGGFRLFAALRQIPAWFLPNIDPLRVEAPRPPMPVGQFWPSTM